MDKIPYPDEILNRVFLSFSNKPDRIKKKKEQIKPPKCMLLSQNIPTLLGGNVKPLVMCPTPSHNKLEGDVL